MDLHRADAKHNGEHQTDEKCEHLKPSWNPNIRVYD
jgi:hypothetical protein